MVKQKNWMVFVALFFAVALGALAFLWPAGQHVFSPQAPQGRIVVIDAGHGGTDGGAVSADGSITESHINLQITRRLALLLLFCGEQVALTRTDEDDLSSPDAATIREQKVSDLKNRVAAINGTGADVLISIHQNSLPEHPSVHGAQVFYNSVQQSNALAATVQQTLNQIINLQNPKNAKAIDASIYLMKEVQCTAILVECGFLSNGAEAQELCTDAHQKNIALSIAAGYLQFTNEGIT